MQWAKQKRLRRILDATEALAKEGKRWQSAVKLDPAKYSRVQGQQTGQPVLRVGVDRATLDSAAKLVRATAARAAARALPYLDKHHKEAVTLHDWSDGVVVGPIRWGGAYARLLPDTALAAAIDGEVWRSLRDDPIAGRDGLADVGRLLHAARANAEPLAPLLMSALFGRKSPALPESWRERPEVVVLYREALSGALRQFCGGKADGVLQAELALAGHPCPLEIPAAALAALSTDMRAWRTRATPPGQALESWAETLAGLDGELLEAAYQAWLQDTVVGETLTALLARENGLELENARLWRGESADVQTLPTLTVLEKLAPEAHARIEQEIKEHAGRFKGKHRRQRGAEFLASLSLLHAFDDWFAAFADENDALLELSLGDPSRLAEEAGRGGLYAFTLAEAEAVVEAETDALQTGHLFADLKGFTALTAQLKEIEVRQFLRQNFYEPLLKIAKDYFKGATDMADRGGVRLNNLLGDAISLCGEPADLLRFSERATRLVQDGVGELLKAQSARDDAESDERRRAAIEAQLSQLKIRKAKGDGDPAAVQAEIENLTGELRAAGARGDRHIELDFGFFVSFGPAPVDLTLNDDVFGKVYVALAEKINESARGVTRDGAVLDAMQACERARPGRRWAFRIHVGPTIQGGIPEALLDGWPTEPEEADVMATALGGQIPFHGSTSMYNVGIGLSPESTGRILADVPGSVSMLRLKSDELDRALGEKYLLLEPRQTLILLPWDDGRRLLRRCGKVAMKGFDLPPTIWEWVGPWMDVYSPLARLVAERGESLDANEALRRAG